MRLLHGWWWKDKVSSCLCALGRRALLRLAVGDNNYQGRVNCLSFKLINTGVAVICKRRGSRVVFVLCMPASTLRSGSDFRQPGLYTQVSYMCILIHGKDDIRT
jgi:hypothetical protein